MWCLVFVICVHGRWRCLDTARLERQRLPFVGEVEGKTATLVKEVLNSV